MFQYTLLLVLGFGGQLPFPSTRSLSAILGWGAITAAGLLTLWAAWAFRETRLHLTPLVREGGTLIVTGPYRWVRHPMYTAVLLLSAGLTVLDPTWLRIGATILMVPALAGKLTVEEELLRLAYPAYGDHAQRTKRMIPGVW
jgi:protein-S-isoprenylcysteine O-methyltransferase Ste14